MELKLTSEEFFELPVVRGAIDTGSGTIYAQRLWYKKEDAIRLWITNGERYWSMDTDSRHEDLYIRVFMFSANHVSDIFDMNVYVQNLCTMTRQWRVYCYGEALEHSPHRRLVK